MNLLEFRQFFRKHSGRYDLVNSDGSDNGANVIINQAQKYLDRLIDIPVGIGRRFIDITQGQFLVTFDQCRSILEVWCVGEDSNGDTTREPLTKYTQQELRGIDAKTLESGYTKIASSITQDRPRYYSPNPMRLITDSDGTTGGVGGMMDVMADGFQTYKGILLMPPSDGDYSIEILGNFYAKTLSTDTDSTFWTAQHEMILYMATMMQLEIIHRNSAGVNDFKSSIYDALVSIDMDGVAEECSTVTQLEG